jgi:hypothetical protein
MNKNTYRKIFEFVEQQLLSELDETEGTQARYRLEIALDVIKQIKNDALGNQQDQEAEGGNE